MTKYFLGTWDDLGLPSLISPDEDMSWRDDAACVDYPNVDFFKLYNNAVEAVAVCNICPVKESCLDFALRNREEYGVWGGMLPKERRELMGAEW